MKFSQEISMFFNTFECLKLSEPENILPRAVLQISYHLRFDFSDATFTLSRFQFRYRNQINKRISRYNIAMYFEQSEVQISKRKVS